MTSQSSTRRDWSVDEVRKLIARKTGKRACWFQVRVAQALYAGRDVVACAPTGAGKTLTFWIPLLMALEDALDMMTIVVTPLNLLGKQNVDLLQKMNIPAIVVDKTNASEKTFKDIEGGLYRVVSINPEILMKHNYLQEMWRKPKVVSKLLNIIFDEGHCIKQWGGFRSDYLHVGTLRHLFPERVPFYVPSATLPWLVQQEIETILKLRPAQTERIICSNDRPEIRLCVRQMQYSARSFEDLAFLIPNGFNEDSPPPPKFLIFFDNKKDAEAGCQYLRSRLPKSLRKKISWFHSLNTVFYRTEEVERLRRHEAYGENATDSFGMGIDLPDIRIVIQWKATCDLSSLWQRFGRAARAAGSDATAILFVERKDTAEEHELKAAGEGRKGKSGGRTKRKATNQLGRPSKRPALGDATPSVNLVAPSEQPICEDEVDPYELREERRASYKKKTFENTKEEKKVEVGSPMYDFINAQHNVKCRRIVLTLFFDNDKAPNNFHQLCDPSLPSGCLRCRPRSVTVCCDLCNPEAFDFLNASAASSKHRGPAKSNIKKFTMTTTDHKLQAALYDWRDDTAPLKFSAAMIEDIGSHLFISDEIIDRIVKCAHVGKLSSVSDLHKETRWRRELANEFGDALLRVVRQFYPPPPPQAPAPSNSGSGTSQDSAPSSRKRALYKCSACGNPGHTSANRDCPKKRENRNPQLESENIDPNPTPGPLMQPPNTYYPSPVAQPYLPQQHMRYPYPSYTFVSTVAALPNVSITYNPTLHR